jgi:hypothetical protein
MTVVFFQFASEKVKFCGNPETRRKQELVDYKQLKPENRGMPRGERRNHQVS